MESAGDFIDLIHLETFEKQVNSAGIFLRVN